MLPSAAEIVARFLRSNGYEQTLSTFLAEAGLPPDSGLIRNDDMTIEKILQEKKTFDLSLNFEKIGLEDGIGGWNLPYPQHSNLVSSLPSSSNVLFASVARVNLSDNGSQPVLVATSADRSLSMISTKSDWSLLRSFNRLYDSPVLSCLFLGDRFLLCSTMSGKLTLLDVAEEKVISNRHDHTKYIVRMAKHQIADDTYIATAGWDGKILLYKLATGSNSEPILDRPVASLSLQTNPESVLFLNHPETGRPLLLVTRRDSTFLYYYSITQSIGALEMLGRQNLAPHSNSWVAFTPSFVALSPTDSSLAAIATSTTPHMKLLVVRLLLPPESGIADVEIITPTQASQSRAEMALQDREEAAIILSSNTFAPQTVYSTPILSWRPNGGGIWISADDGIIRGIDIKTGKVSAQLKGHTPMSKIRTLWAGYIDSSEEATSPTEIVVSGGFDQKLIVWTAIST